MGIAEGTLLAYAAVASAAVGAGAAIYSGDQQRKAMHANADQAQADADAAAAEGRVQAQKLREAAKRQRASAAAALAASGVDVGEGTAELIQQDITDRGEQDALTTILSGSRRSALLGREAEVSRIGGSNAQTAGYIGAASSVLSSANSYYGWKARQK